MKPTNTISHRAANALFKYTRFSESNTQVTIHKHDNHSTAELRVHGSIIATLDPYDGFLITDSGWRSKLTRSRLNALPSVTLKGDTLTTSEFEIKDWDGEWTQIPYLGKDVLELQRAVR